MKKTLIGLAAAALMVPASAMAERDGATVYNTYCLACHMVGVAGAPKMGDAAAWAPRAAKGVDALLATAKTGINAMPPMGTCMDCSDAELKGAIEHMINSSK
jgi:cytochrome c5